MPNILELRPNFRKHACADYFINGKRLADILDIGGLISPFGWLDTRSEDQFGRMLLGLAKSDFRENRIPLFICSECADYGCGVGSCEIEFTDETATWKNFGWETNYEDKLIPHGGNPNLRFSFELMQYRSVFQRYGGTV